MYRFRMLMMAGLVLTAQAVSATSLYDAKRFKALHADKKAVKVGDAVTILVYETVQANSSAGEGSSGDLSFAGNASVDDRRWSAGLNLGSSNSGDAATNRQGFVRAQLTAAVVTVDEHGGLLIEGQQTIKVNEESQLVKVKGRVRPEDINSNNTVASFRIQNAEISINGEGIVASGKNGNIFTRLARWMGF